MNYGTFLRLSAPENAEKEFSALAERGFDCCHLVYKPEKYTSEAAELIKAAAEKSGVEISALFAGFKDSHTKWNISTDYEDAGINSKKYGKERIEYLKSATEFCTFIGTKNILIHGGFISNNPYSEEYIYTLKVFKEFALFCKEKGINLLLETGGESPVTLLRLIKEADTGNIFVNLDTANIIMYGYGNPADAVYTLAPYIKSVHLKDGLPPIDPYELGKEVDFGTGFADFPKVFALLNKNCFGGPFIIEREIPDGRQTEEINKTLSAIKELWSKTLEAKDYTVISCIGDSLTEGDYGVYMKRGIANVHKENYPYFLSRLLDAKVQNFGRCGCTASHIIKRYSDGLIDVTGSDIVMIMLGTNGGNSPDCETQANKDYKAIIEKVRLQAPKAKIVLCTPPHATDDTAKSNCGYMPNVLAAAKFINRLAEELSLDVIDVLSCPDFTAEAEEIMQPNDGLHFSEKGYKALAQFIGAELKKLYPDLV